MVRTKRDPNNSSIDYLKSTDGVELHDDLIANEFNKFFGSFSLPRVVTETDSTNFINETFRELKVCNRLTTHRF